MNLSFRQIQPTLKKAAPFLWVIPVLFFAFAIRPRLEAYLFQDMIISTYSETAAIRNRILSRKYEKALPLAQKGVEKISMYSRAGMSVLIKPNGDKKMLFEKNTSEALPMASISKLMTALVVLENYNLGQEVIFSKESAGKEGEPNFFRTGESFYVSDLLYSALVESSNRASYALSEVIGEKEFVSAMNQRARELGMDNTKFSNPSGLDPDLDGIDANQASAQDLELLAEYLIQKPIIGQMCRTESRAIHQVNGSFHHVMKTTNELLGQIPDIVLAKTGQTPLAKECLVVAFEKPKYGVVINVILGSEDSFSEMRRLTNWVNNAYKW